MHDNVETTVEQWLSAEEETKSQKNMCKEVDHLNDMTCRTVALRMMQGNETVLRTKFAFERKADRNNMIENHKTGLVV